jgi:hypothetical protein
LQIILSAYSERNIKQKGLKNDYRENLSRRRSSQIISRNYTSFERSGYQPSRQVEGREMKFKYIMTVDGPVLFSPAISHDSVLLPLPALSAGFVELAIDDGGDNIRARCYGDSESLEMASMPQDAGIIELYASLLK